MRLIPAMDIIGGKCVRLTQGDYSASVTYSDNPVETAMMFEAYGIKYLHLVDLEGAKSAHIINNKTLSEISGKTNLVIDFGGGLKSDDDLKKAFDSGASKVTIGSVAVTNEKLFLNWIERYGCERIILGADFRNGLVSYNGWISESGGNITDFLKRYEEAGVKYAICTDIRRDGMLSGPATETYRQIAGCTEINIIASGGVSSMEDIYSLEDTGCEGAIIGKALYEGKITLSQLKNYVEE